MAKRYYKTNVVSTSFKIRLKQLGYFVTFRYGKALEGKRIGHSEVQNVVTVMLILLEAAIGIEPMNKGFADLCLTTWLRRLIEKTERGANRNAEGGEMK